MRYRDVSINKVINRIRDQNNSSSRFRSICSIRFRSCIALRVTICLFMNSSFAYVNCKIILIFRWDVITITRLSKDGQDLARDVIRRITSAYHQDDRVATMCHRVYDRFRAAICLDIGINACVRLIMINVSCRSIFVVVIRYRQMDCFISATFSARDSNY